MKGIWGRSNDRDDDGDGDNLSKMEKKECIWNRGRTDRSGKWMIRKGGNIIDWKKIIARKIKKRRPESRGRGKSPTLSSTRRVPW